MNQNKTTNGAPNGLDQPPVLYEDPLNIERSPFNRAIDKANLGELTDSVRTHGIIEPLIVRQCYDVPGSFQLIAGERRLRAAMAAKLKTVPIIVRQANDQEVIELQTIENDQREGLSPIDRAKSYNLLLEQYEKNGLKRSAAIEQLAKRVGRSRSSVYETLSLIDSLAPPVQKVVEAGKMPPSHAALLAPLKDAPELQETLTKIIAPEDPDSKELKRSEQRRWIYNPERDAKGVMGFRDAKDLVKKEIEKNDARKKWEAIAEKHRAAGGRVLTEAEQEHHISDYGSARFGFVATHDYTTAYSSGWQGKQWGKLVGKSAPQILAHDRDYKAVWLYEKKVAEQALEKKGVKKVQHRPAGGGTATNNYEAEERRRREKEAKMKPVEAAATKQILKLAEQPKPKFPWLLFFKDMFECRGGASEIARHFGWSKNDVQNKLAGAPESKRNVALIILMLDEGRIGWDSYGKKWDPEFVGLCKYYGINLEKLEQELTPEPEPKATPKVAGKGLSAPGRKRLAALMKKRWAARRKKGAGK